MKGLNDINWSGVIAALPALGVFLKALVPFADRGLERRLKRHMELLSGAPEGVDASSLKALVEYETLVIAQRNHKRLTRQVNWSTVAAIVVVLVIAALSVLGLWALSNSDAVPNWLGVACRVLAFAVGAFGFLLAAIGGGSQVWKGDEDEKGAGTSG